MTTLDYISSLLMYKYHINRDEVDCRLQITSIWSAIRNINNVNYIYLIAKSSISRLKRGKKKKTHRNRHKIVIESQQ